MHMSRARTMGAATVVKRVPSATPAQPSDTRMGRVSKALDWWLYTSSWAPDRKYAVRQRPYAVAKIA